MSDGKRKLDELIGESKEVPEGTYKVVFLGTGVSTAIPNMGHVMFGGCKTCEQAQIAGNKNRRNNVSIAVVFQSPTTKEQACVLVDAGKTMRDSCMRHLPTHHITHINGVLLTHGHADAVLGLDDIRDFQKSERVSVKNANGTETTGYKVVGGALPIYLHQQTMDVVGKAFSYLTTPPAYIDKAAGVLERRVAHLSFEVVAPRSQLSVAGLPIDVFPVFHGGEYISLGFSFGTPGSFIYISDVSSIPPDSLTFLQSLKIQTLVLDLIGMTGIFPHVGMEEALKVVDQLKPVQTYFVGMGCEHDHNFLEKELASRGPNLFLAWDGLTLDNISLGSSV